MREFGLIGQPLSHSFSKKYFTARFSKEHLTDCRYDNYELSNIGQLPALLKDHPLLEGLNVTIPYKEAVLSFLDEKTELVNTVGACNCIKIKNGRLTGYNTDVPAFRIALESWLEPHHTSALVLGNGGASKAVQCALRDLDIEYRVVSRHPAEGEFEYADIGHEVLKEFSIIINTTPLGMFPDVDNAPSIDYNYITDRHFLFDLIYNPPKTKFLAEGEKRSAKIVNGYEMLVRQAEESWRIWNAP